MGAWLPVPQDRAFAELVDFVEQEGREHVPSLLVLFQRAIRSDPAIFASTFRLHSHVRDLDWHGPGSTGEAHQVSVDLDFLATQYDVAWRRPAEALGSSPSSTRDLLILARRRHAQGVCPGWVVARLKAAVGDE